MDFFSFNRNQFIGFNDRQLLVIELDHEAKAPDESIFGVKSDLYDELKIQAMQADVRYPKKTMFNRVHTIAESIEKYEQDNKGKPVSRRADFQQLGKTTSQSKSADKRAAQAQDLLAKPRDQDAMSDTKNLMQKNLA